MITWKSTQWWYVNDATNLTICHKYRHLSVQPRVQNTGLYSHMYRTLVCTVMCTEHATIQSFVQNTHLHSHVYGHSSVKSHVENTRASLWFTHKLQTLNLFMMYVNCKQEVNRKHKEYTTRPVQPLHIFTYKQTCILHMYINKPPFLRVSKFSVSVSFIKEYKTL